MVFAANTFPIVSYIEPDDLVALVQMEAATVRSMRTSALLSGIYRGRDVIIDFDAPQVQVRYESGFL
jgi:hypothetical protein